MMLTVVESCIGHRLSATCLFLGIDHFETQRAEKFIRGDTYFRIEGIHVARDKQSYLHRSSR